MELRQASPDPLSKAHGPMLLSKQDPKPWRCEHQPGFFFLGYRDWAAHLSPLAEVTRLTVHPGSQKEQSPPTPAMAAKMLPW